MAVFRVNKNKDYTAMSNIHLRDSNLSLKAKGLLSVMLALPEKWDYSVVGLASICKEAKNTINEILKELQKNNYLERKRIYQNGKIVDWEYVIYENNLHRKNEDIENQDIENQDIENWSQLNTKQLNKDKLNTEEYKALHGNAPVTKQEEKHKYGEYKHILLTDAQYEKLVKDFGTNNTKLLIKKLDEAIEIKGYKYKNHNLVIRGWVLTETKKSALWEKKQPEREYVIDTSEQDKQTDEMLQDDKSKREFEEFMKSRTVRGFKSL